MLGESEEPKVGSKVKVLLWAFGATSFCGVYLGIKKDEGTQEFSLENGTIVHSDDCFLIEVEDSEETILH